MISDILLYKFFDEFSHEKDLLHDIDKCDINSLKYREFYYKNESCDFFKLKDLLCTIIF